MMIKMIGADNFMSKSFFDYEDGDFALSISDNMAIDTIFDTISPMVYVELCRVIMSYVIIGTLIPTMKTLADK